MFGKKKSLSTKVVDPVCGMSVNPESAAATRDLGGETVYFCSLGCAQAFESDPQRYGHGQTHAGNQH